MNDGRKWARWAERMPLLLQGGLTGDELAGMRRHLEICPRCRGELGSFFPLDRWAEDALPDQDIPAGFTAAVLARLPDPLGADGGGRASGAAVTAGRAGGFGRRTLLLNYLAAAAATLILIFTNAFGLFADLAARADQLNAGARGITIQTQRLVEAPPRWLDLLKLRFLGNVHPHERGR